ncbi:MAG: Peptidyl-tRNA hydrolase, partial [Synergistales bacterium 54_9]
MRLVLGLGNPGPEYAWTRHNIGWLVVDALLEEVGDVPSSETRRLRRWGPFELEGSRVIVVKPLTYMNRSGLALYELPGDFLENPRRILVVYDDMA